MTSALDLYHKWMKEWGSSIGDREREVVADIDRLFKEIRDEALEEAAKVLVSAAIRWGSRAMPDERLLILAAAVRGLKEKKASEP
jgi:hypothetical protein